MEKIVTIIKHIPYVLLWLFAIITTIVAFSFGDLAQADPSISISYIVNLLLSIGLIAAAGICIAFAKVYEGIYLKG